MSGSRARAWVAASTSLLAAVLFVACGSGSSRPSSAPRTDTSSTSSSSSTIVPFRDVEPTAATFVNINSMTRVGDHFVGSLNGHLADALAVAHSATGGAYPVGTIIQLVPTEAMVKRRSGYSAATGDWEFFSLKVSPAGTKIVSSGAVVKNFFGGDCSSCHSLAAKRFDFVCGKNHGCAPLPLSDKTISLIQSLDPRPRD